MKKEYIKPLCVIHKVKVEYAFLAGGSVTVSGADQEDWEPNENHNSGGIGVGDGSDVDNF